MNQVVPNRRPSIAEELSKRIRAFKKKRPHLSSQQIAKRFDISNSSLNRIENLDIKTPSFDQIIKVLRGTGNEDDVISFLESNYPELSETMRDYYRAGKDMKKLDQTFVEGLKDPYSATILLLAICRQKTSLDFIQNEFGLRGIKIVKDLQLKKLITIQNGSIFPSSEFIIPSLKDTTEILASLISNNYDYRGYEEKVADNHLTLEVYSVNSNKAIPLIKDILDEAKSKFREVVTHQDMAGDDVIFLGLVADTMLNNTIQYENSRLKERMQ